MRSVHVGSSPSEVSHTAQETRRHNLLVSQGGCTANAFWSESASETSWTAGSLRLNFVQKGRGFVICNKHGALRCSIFNLLSHR